MNIRCACLFTEKVANSTEEDNPSKRAEVKQLLASLEKVNPYITKNIFRNVENVNLNTVITYKKNGERHHFLDEYEVYDWKEI